MWRGTTLRAQTRLGVVDGPGEGIETDRIGAEGRSYGVRMRTRMRMRERIRGGIVLRRRGYWRTVTAWLGASPPLVG